MKYMLKTAMAVTVLLGLPLCASAADYNDGTVSGQIRQDAREAREATRDAARDVREDVRDYRNDVRDARRDLREDMQDRSDEATMRRLERQEDKQSVSEYIDDAGVTAKVKGRFIEQKGLDSLDIKVVTVDGNVTLMGDVDNSAQIGLAETVAKEIKGVRSVDNRLVLKK